MLLLTTALAAAAATPTDTAAGAARQLRAGAATSNITPKLGTSLNGGMRDNRAQHIHDDLHVRCLVLDDGKTRLAFAVADSCMLPRDVTEKARGLVAEETGLPP